MSNSPTNCMIPEFLNCTSSKLMIIGIGLSLLSYAGLYIYHLATPDSPHLNVLTLLVTALTVIGLVSNLVWLKLQSFKAEKKLSAAEHRYHLVVKGASSGIWEWDLTTNTMIWSSRLRLMLGITQKEWEPTWDDFLSRVHPDDIDWFSTILDQHLTYNNIFDMEFRIQHKSGNYIWVQGFAQAQWNQQKKPTHMAGSITNINKRKLAEEKYNQLSQHNRNVLNALDQSAIVAITDPNGVITHTNEKFCDITGFSRDEALGKTHRIVNSGYHSKEEIEQLWATIKYGDIWEGDLCNKTKDGKLYWVKTTIIPFLDKHGTPYQFVSFRHDITAQKHAEETMLAAKETAEKASQLKSQFLKLISHELRTPLNAILGMTQLLTETDLNDEQMEYSKTLGNSSLTLLNIVSDILDFEHLNRQHIELIQKPFNLNDCLTSINHQIAPYVQSSPNIKFSVHTSPSIPEVIYGDESRLRQVVMHLLVNAFKYTDEGEISFHIKALPIDPHHTKLTFKVVDTGIGIATDKIKDLFDHFTQVTDFSTRKHEGLGLGLAISQKVALAMNSEITVNSIEGQGSAFELTVCLPTGQLNQTLSQQLSHSVDHVIGQLDQLESTFRPHPQKKPLILLVEDNEINQMVTQRMLEKSGYLVDVAENGHIAIEKFKQAFDQTPYQAILMDCQMPEMNGFQATQNIRDIEVDLKRATPTPIIALTANVMPGDDEECLKAGMNDYLGKPIRKQQLLDMLSKWGAFAEDLSPITSVANTASGQPHTSQAQTGQAQVNTIPI